MGKEGRQKERRDCVKTSQLGVIYGRKCVTDIKRNSFVSTEVSQNNNKKYRFTLMEICKSKVMK